MSLLDDVDGIREPIRDVCRSVLRARLEAQASDTIGGDTLTVAVRNLADDLLQSIGRGGHQTPLWWVEVAAPFAQAVPEVAEQLSFLNASSESFEPYVNEEQASIIADYRALTRPRLV